MGSTESMPSRHAVSRNLCPFASSGGCDNDGWGAWIPTIELVAVPALGVLAWRTAGRTRWLLVAAIASILMAEAPIWPVWVLPTNRALDGWTAAEPMPGWEALRLSREAGHAARFVVPLAGFLAAAWALVGPSTARRCAAAS